MFDFFHYKLVQVTLCGEVSEEVRLTERSVNRYLAYAYRRSFDV